jgi:hypothetical protein
MAVPGRRKGVKPINLFQIFCSQRTNGLANIAGQIRSATDRRFRSYTLSDLVWKIWNFPRAHDIVGG